MSKKNLILLDKPKRADVEVMDALFQLVSDIKIKRHPHSFIIPKPYKRKKK